MSKKTPASADPARPLPERANLEHLRKEAKQRLKAMRLDNPGVKLSAVQLTVAREYGFSSWRSLIAYVKSQSDKESQLRDQRRTARARPLWLQAVHDGLEVVGKGDYQTAMAHFRHAETEYSALTLSTVQLAVTKKFGESRWHDLFAYIKSLPDAVAKYQWLRSQSENSIGDLDDSTYELLPDEPRGGNLVQNPFHRAYAAKLAQYLLDLIPPQVAERYGLPRSRIIFDDDLDVHSQTPEDPNRRRQAMLIDDQREARKPATILYKVMPKYTEIARLNRLEGAVVVSAYFTAEGAIAGIRVARGLPDGLTWRAILAMRMVRFTPASINGAPVRTREFIEFNFNLH